MRRRAAFWLAWSLAGLSFDMFVAGIAFAFLTLNVADPVVLPSSDWGTGWAIGELLVFVPFLAFPIVGALIASRRPRNPIGWICLIAGLFWMLIVMNDQSTAYSLARTGTAWHAPVLLDALGQSVWVPPLGLLGTFMVMLFPDGRLPSRRWRPLALLSGTAILLASVALDLDPGPLPDRAGVRNPLGIEHPWIHIVEEACLLFLAGCRQDMQDQPRMKPFRSSTFFRDGISSRPPVTGTVPRGFLKADSEFFTGKKTQT